MSRDPEAATAARDFVMARLAACRASISVAGEALDQALVLFVDVDADKKGEERADFLDTVDLALGEGARAVQAAQEMLDDVDPKEGEPDLPEGDGHDDEDDDSEDEE